MFRIHILLKFGKSWKMIETLISLKIYDWAILYIFFVGSSAFGAFYIKWYFSKIFKKVLENELNGYQQVSEKIVQNFEDKAQGLDRQLENIQAYSIKNFDHINRSFGELSEVLIKFKQHMVKVEDLENEIVKYKKIIKRMEKKNEL